MSAEREREEVLTEDECHTFDKAWERWDQGNTDHDDVRDLLYIVKRFRHRRAPREEPGRRDGEPSAFAVTDAIESLRKTKRLILMGGESVNAVVSRIDDALECLSHSTEARPNGK